MGRRKQARPTKCSPEDFDTAEPEPKMAKCEVQQPSTSGQSSTPTFVHPSVFFPPSTSSSSKNPLALLESSLNKLNASPKGTPTTQSPAVSSSSLGALFNIVGKLNAPINHGPDSSRTEPGVSSILKCLQCGFSCAKMEQLVKHMADTKHFSNLPKPHTTNLQLDRQKVLNLKLIVKTGSFKLACIKCGEIPTNIDKHLKEVHDVKTYGDWLQGVKLINNSAQPVSTQQTISPHLNNLMSLINTVEKK